MQKLLKVSQNTAYRIRRELLKDYNAQKEARAAQYDTAPKEASSSQQEKKTAVEAAL
jgi:hypothetical protein